MRGRFIGANCDYTTGVRLLNAGNPREVLFVSCSWFNPALPKFTMAGSCITTEKSLVFSTAHHHLDRLYSSGSATGEQKKLVKDEPLIGYVRSSADSTRL